MTYFINNPQAFLKLRVSKNNFLILIYDSIDTKSYFYELLSRDICHFPKLNLQQFISIINSITPLNTKNCETLLEITDYNSKRVFSELNKIDILSKINKKDVNEVFEESLKDGLIYRDNTKEYNEWIDAIIKKDFKEAIDCGNKISKIDDDTMRLIHTLHENYKTLLISGSTRIKYSKQELIDKIDFVHSCEMGLKNGYLEEEFVRNYLMINLILN
jgi:DNA polymerase III delta subunit